MSVYKPTKWVNDNPPSIDGNNLNHVERGTEDAHNEIEDIAMGRTTVLLAERANKSRFIAAASQTIRGGIKIYNIVDGVTGDVTSIISAPAVTDPPKLIIDFRASDSLPGMIRVTFTPVDAIYYDLYRNGSLVATDIPPTYTFLTGAGTWNFHVVAVNIFGSTPSVADSGTAKAIPTAPPAAITNFSASDRQSFKVIMLWTDHGDASKFDLYADGGLVAEDILPGFSYIVEEGTKIYHIVATNFLGTTESNEDSGTSKGLTPDAPQNFYASDDQIANINMVFDYVDQPVIYSLYKDNVLAVEQIYSDYDFASIDCTCEFFVRAINLMGYSDSNIDEGTALPAQYPPSQITDFSVSDDLRLSIKISFTPATDAGRYDLYRGTTLFWSNVYPDMVLDIEAGTWQFRVHAVNNIGSTESNPDSGTSLPAFSDIPDEITDFVASDTLVNSLQITYTHVSEVSRYDLFKNGVVYKTDVISGDVFPSFEGTWDFYISAINPIGSQNSNMDSGTVVSAISAPPAISDFSASDNEVAKIISTFSLVEGAARYDLYRDNLMVAEDITPGYEYLTDSGTWTFFVRALNLKGSSDSNTDSGTAIEAAQPPSAISDFEASDGLTAEIIMTFTPAIGAVSHDLWRDGALLTTNIHSGYSLAAVGSWEFYVVAHNAVGSTPSNVNDGSSIPVVEPPDYDSTLLASDNEIEQVTITWLGVSNADSYDLYVDDTLLQSNASSGYIHVVSPGSRVYHHVAINTGGSTPSNSDVGISVAELEPPIPVSDFKASTCYIDKVVFTWSDVPGADYYSVYSANGLELEDAHSGATLIVGSAHSLNYWVKAINASGSVDSNHSTGTTWVASGELELFASRAIVGGVDIPANVLLTVCMIGGGGSGSARRRPSDTRGREYGGYAGEIVNTIKTFECDESILFVAGIGGPSVTATSGEYGIPGNPGTESALDTLTAAGGAGGISPGYEGYSDYTITVVCGQDTSDGGGQESGDWEWVAFGGEGGLGIAGQGRIDNFALFPGRIMDGGPGSGGGAHVVDELPENAVSGKGGDGMLRLTWGTI